MVETVVFPLDDGGELYVRVEDGTPVPSPPGGESDSGPVAAAPGGVVTRGGRSSAATLERAQRSFEAALGPIRTVAQGVLGQLSSLPRAPDEVRVEFGVELSAQAGAILAAAGSTAHLKVGLTWKADRAEAARADGQRGAGGLGSG